MTSENPFQAPAAGLEPSGWEGLIKGLGIRGLDGIDRAELIKELKKGARFVVFPYCISFLVVTVRKNSPIYFLRDGESARKKGRSWFFLSLIAGWWAMPFGFFRTPEVLLRTLSGGDDLTDEVLKVLRIEPQWHPTGPIRTPESPN